MQTVIDISVLIVSDDRRASRVLIAVLRALKVERITSVGLDEVPDYDVFDLALIACVGETTMALEAAELVRRRPDSPGAHIVVLALGVTEELERYLQWGRIDGVMKKPVTIASVAAQIECAIDRRMRG